MKTIKESAFHLPDRSAAPSMRDQHSGEYFRGNDERVEVRARDSFDAARDDGSRDFL